MLRKRSLPHLIKSTVVLHASKPTDAFRAAADIHTGVSTVSNRSWLETLSEVQAFLHLFTSDGKQVEK